MTRWWSGQGDERFWIEVTNRSDIGADLHAPKLDRSGKRNWRYNLIEETSVGDVVFHYDTRSREIVGFSVVSGPPRSDRIKWAARGTYARKERAQPIEVDSTKVPLEGLTRLDPPVSREVLKKVAPMMKMIEESIRSRSGTSTYFPFFTSDGRGGDTNQGYFFKMPLELVKLLNIEPKTPLAPTDDPVVLERAVEYLLKRGCTGPPPGQLRPQRSINRAGMFFRDPSVKAYTLQEASGTCELCGGNAPFRDSAGHPFLEVHHVVPLAEGGSDTTENAVALCPNCHRACHHAEDRHERAAQLRQRIAGIRGRGEK